MIMKENDIKEKLNSIIQSSEEYKDYKIEYIIHYRDTDNYEAIAVDGEDMASIFLKSEEIEPLINSLYDLDDEIFGSLEYMEGEIAYMSFNTHSGIWNYIDENIDDINYSYGLEQYLRYCKENNITKSIIDDKMKLDVPDIMKYYKNREIKVLGMWETDYGDIACNALLLEKNKKVANIIEIYDVDKQKIVGQVYKSFDYFVELPKISNCSKLLQFIYDSVCESDSSMCHITGEDWNDYYIDNFNDKDIDILKEEVKKYNLDNVISFDYEEYAIIGWGDLQTKFNDDRRFDRARDNER